MSTENLNALIVEVNWKSKPSERCRVRRSGHTVEKAICKGPLRTLQDAQYGQLNAIDNMSIWFKESDEPAEWEGEAIIAQPVEVSFVGGPFLPLRVLGRAVIQGGVNLIVSSTDGSR